MKKCNLVELDKGEKARVIKYEGGHGLGDKLNAMGLIPGKEIVKISGAFIGGPVTIKVGNAKIAIGRGMASRIILEVLH